MIGKFKATDRFIIKTEVGDIEMALFSENAPNTVANFIRYVEQGRFEDARFFRVVTPENQPNDSIRIEVIQGEIVGQEEGFAAIQLETTRETGLRHLDGAVSMARGAPHTAKSSFFICIGDQPELDFGGMRNPDGQGFAAFGQVTKGMDIVKLIQQGAAEGQSLVEPVNISTVKRM